MLPAKDISRLIEIMAALRTPVTGCPWDLEQDFASIAPYTLEEAYEVADAIERGDMDDLRDELGDLLLLVVYHARMAEEAGDFAFGDVVEAITKKMIRRHPHVFGDAEARAAGSAKGMWDAIKAEEKAQKRAARTARGLPAEDHGHGFLDSVPVALPALVRARKLQDRAAKVGFDWKEAAPILDKIEEEIAELRQAIAEGDKAAMSDEFGDVLFALVNFGRHVDVEAETALQGTNAKFRRRFHFIERELAASGRRLGEVTLEEMEALWQRAKGVEG
ncbi:nucleoside triphosphate pyrophosphohydrolase [Aquibium sp. ELW1220]|uniref:nucleoside triphosphate pyrophosphohydrolase n=1 Tax=Aquibium sp. ELW1220 TaxID=2976766 RepID=UPI0025AEFC5F|nr:nucleoside triphosphate pyrophosphohydrolase [Aquibium sp. ELW1220]MDN2583571.1 nucleoside triphosphate pyrophosphohydrolase [Aquibium sp. ELW1220]